MVFAGTWYIFYDYNTYDDCMLSNMKPNMTNAALSIVQSSCRNKFPIKKHIETKSEKAARFERQKQKRWADRLKRRLFKICSDYAVIVSKDPRTAQVSFFDYTDITNTNNGYKVIFNITDSGGKRRATCYLDNKSNIIDFSSVDATYYFPGSVFN